MKNNKLKLIFGLYCLVAIWNLLFGISIVSASGASGAIINGGNNGYAWSDQSGWINFGAANGNINITDAGITGYAWNSNYGWINMAPTNGGVFVAASGALSGYAWGAGLGWINFSGVSINSSGKFIGQAIGSNVGNLIFDCANCSVTTDFRPSNFRISTSIQAGASGGGAGGGGGGSNVVLSRISAYNVPLTIAPNQSGSLEQNVSNNKKVLLDVPQNSVKSRVTFNINEEPLAPDINFALLPSGADLINSVFYNIVARDENNNLVHSFSDYLGITLPISQSFHDFSDLTVYWLDENAGAWRQIPDAVFSGDSASVSFKVNHLTKFAIFRIFNKLTEVLQLPRAISLSQQSQQEISSTSPRIFSNVAFVEREVIGPIESKIPKQLFDIRLILDRSNIANINDLVARVTFTSFGFMPTPIDMNFSILDSKGNEIWKGLDTTTVQTEAVFIKRFFNLAINDGKYTLKLHTRYNKNVEDDFTASFTIEKTNAKSYWIIYLLSGVAIIIIALLLSLIFLKKRQVL